MLVSEYHSMPSTHSAGMAYYAAYTVLASCYLPVHHSLPNELTTRVVSPLIVVPWAMTVAISRAWLGHHTWSQVVAGCVHGLVFTLVWYNIWVQGAHERGRILEDMYLAGL